MLPTLHTDPPLLRRYPLAVGDENVLNVQEYGNPHGIPALVLHGGPGSGCSPLLRRFFDARRYRIICPDQRGAGGSRPRGSTRCNTTADLLADLGTLRRRLGLARWLVVGGSWGATLALAHAAAEPQAVQALLLRATFLARREDIDWFFQGAATQAAQPWARFAAAAPAGERSALLAWLVRVFESGTSQQQEHAARAWWSWEQALAAGAAGAAAAVAQDGDDLAALVDRYRVQSHYLANDAWLTEPPLLDRVAALPHVPTLLLHGVDDRVCRPAGARALHERVWHSRLVWVEGAGHDPAHPAMLSAMVRALDAYAEHGDFSRLEACRCA